MSRAIQLSQRFRTLRDTALRPQNRWRTLWLLFSWACLLYACVRTWQVIDGRMYYLLDSDMSSDLVLSYLLRKEHTLLTPNWFYSTELRVYQNEWIFTPLFFFMDNWLQVRMTGTAIILLGMLASCWYFCHQAGIGRLFPAVGTLLIMPMSDVYFRIALLGVSYAPYLLISFLNLGLLFHYMRSDRRRTRILLLVAQGLVSLAIGLNGLRQMITFYLPLLLSVLFLCLLKSTPRPDATLPGIPRPERRLLVSSLVAAGAALLGSAINTGVLRYLYHYTSQEGIKFARFDAERLEQLFFGFLESFGFQTGEYVTSPQLLNNAFCFLSLLILLCAYISLARSPQRYTLPEKTFYLLSFFGFLVYEALYLFTDMVYYTRYNIAVVVLMMPVGVDFLYRLPRCRLWRGAMLGTMAALLLWCGNTYYTELWPVNMTSNHEQAVAALRVAGYTEGYATFWNANLMVELSNGAFDIRVWRPGGDITDPDDMYEWMQTTEHLNTTPEGPVFLFFNKAEGEYETASQRLTEGTVEFENEKFIAIGYPSYEAMRADFSS